MASVVVDASLIVHLLIDESWGGGAEHILGDRDLAAPAHIDAEILQAVRNLSRAGVLDPDAGTDALVRCAEMPVARVPLAHLLPEAWALRDNLSAYDALYVALARALECELVTADRRLAAAPSLGISIKLVSG